VRAPSVQPITLNGGQHASRPALAQVPAREAAEQLAKDSRTALGGIRRASQGVFVILPRDQAPGVDESNQLQKIVRVVSTGQYFLK
jgi:uncharacterized protein